jgi:hypothetical protein
MGELDEVAALFAAGQVPAGLARVRARLAWPYGKQVAPNELPEWIAMVARVADHHQLNELSELAHAAVLDPDSPDRLYDLGYALIDGGAPAIAATVLWRCLALVGDSEEVVCELVSALETALAYEDAFAILEHHAALRARSFLCAYLHAFNAAMTGRLDVTRAALTLLHAEAPEHEVMRATLEAMCERADRVAGVCALDTRDVRGWHYVLTGGLLLHRSPWGVDEMRGRYAWLNDSADLVAFGLERLVALLGGAPPPCVYAPTGRRHEIVARALAARLGVPLVPWPAIGVPAPGLVALYDLAELPSSEQARLVQRRPGQILFAHASPWTRDSPIAPDVTTVLYQVLEPTWDGDGDPAALADELVGRVADPELADDAPEVWAALAARTWPPAAPAMRSRLWAGGPVPSNRFEADPAG